MTRRALALAAVLAASLVAASPAPAARLVTWTTHSRHVAGALRVNVLLPDGYDGRRRFPVLFLLHGHGDAYDSWASPARGDVARVARRLRAVIVMPEGDRGWYVNWWRGGRRGNPGWERYHLDELVPLVERRLRIRRGRRWHAIAGLSMGGEGSLFYASQRPGWFGAAASFSGAISIQRPEWPLAFDTQGERHADVFGDPVRQRFYWTGHNPVALVRNLRQTRVFVAVGDGVPGNSDEAKNGFGKAAERLLRLQAADFVAAARRAGVVLTYRPQQGIHDWPYWRRHLAQAIAWGLVQTGAGDERRLELPHRCGLRRSLGRALPLRPPAGGRRGPCAPRPSPPRDWARQGGTSNARRLPTAPSTALQPGAQRALLGALALAGGLPGPSALRNFVGGGVFWRQSGCTPRSLRDGRFTHG